RRIWSGTTMLLKHGAGLFSDAGLLSRYFRPALIPVDPVQQHDPAAVGILPVKRMVKHPVLPRFIGHDIAVVTRAGEPVVPLQDQRSAIIQQGFPLPVQIRPTQRGGPAHFYAVRAGGSFAATPDRTEEIIIRVPLQNIHSLVRVSGHAEFLPLYPGTVFG